MNDETKEIKVILRPPTESDRSFIMGSWLPGNYHSTHFRSMPEDLYYKKYHDYIEDLIISGVEITVASNENDPIWVVGFSVTKDDALYWIFVKKEFRNNGIANLMMKGKNLKRIKAITPPGRAIARKKGLIYDPL